jgi:hypothetical protein
MTIDVPGIKRAYDRFPRRTVADQLLTKEFERIRNNCLSILMLGDQDISYRERGKD